ncbi:MAG: PDZ domain-containing protein [Ruminococcus sp.]|nr:PDZ domain-containing protein [Ruminococcus sp.]
MELTNKVINSFLALSASAALGAGGMYLYNKNKIEAADKYSLISECETILKENEVKLPENADIETAVLRGYLSAYDDDYTFYREDTNLEEYIAAINGGPCMQTCGYLVKANNEGQLEILNVKAGSPAEKQGLRTGDIILRINDDVIAEKGIKATVLGLSGKDGTEMDLEIERDGKRSMIHFVRSTKQENAINEVEAEKIGDVAYISISGFSISTAMFFNGYYDEYISGSKGLIIDLRDNPGGILEYAVETADLLIGDGVATSYYYTGKVEECFTTSSPDDIKMKIVLLCNEQTASAAEVFTALLKQYGEDVTIVGTNTFGKGIFQEEKQLSNGGILRYTAGYYTIGEWECYDGVGIAPDVSVDMDREYIGTENDVQLEKALELFG